MSKRNKQPKKIEAVPPPPFEQPKDEIKYFCHGCNKYFPSSAELMRHECKEPRTMVIRSKPWIGSEPSDCEPEIERCDEPPSFAAARAEAAAHGVDLPDAVATIRDSKAIVIFPDASQLMVDCTDGLPPMHELIRRAAESGEAFRQAMEGGHA